MKNHNVNSNARKKRLPRRCGKDDWFYLDRVSVKSHSTLDVPIVLKAAKKLEKKKKKQQQTAGANATGNPRNVETRVTPKQAQPGTRKSPQLKGTPRTATVYTDGSDSESSGSRASTPGPDVSVEHKEDFTITFSDGEDDTPTEVEGSTQPLIEQSEPSQPHDSSPRDQGRVTAECNAIACFAI